ncbi:MAG: DinB family protein [Bacteroidia bacterium]
MSEKIIYVNSQGERFENSLQDVLFHLINYGTHHRAQISTLFRQNDMAPPAADYFFWVRKK